MTITKTAESRVLLKQTLLNRGWEIEEKNRKEWRLRAEDSSGVIIATVKIHEYESGKEATYKIIDLQTEPKA